jgi:hypothetical protein
LISSKKSEEVARYISNDTVMRQSPITVIERFGVEYLDVKDDTAIAVIEYEMFGQINDALVYKPIADLPRRNEGEPATGILQVEFRLRRAMKGSSEWVITSAGAGPHVNICNAILYLKTEQKSNSLATNRTNAEKAVSLLQASLSRQCVP